MTERSGAADLDALRAEVARLQAGGSPHPPPRSSPGPTPPGGDRNLDADPPAKDQPTNGPASEVAGTEKVTARATSWSSSRDEAPRRGRKRSGGTRARDTGVAGDAGSARERKAASAFGGSEAARDPHAVAKAIVLRQLTNSPKTRAQLETTLAKRECDPEVAAEVLDRLTEVGLIDDRVYAETYVRSKQISRGLSRRALAHELRTKGVTKDLAGEVLDGIDDAAEEERARALVRSRLPRLHGAERPAQVRRLAGLLARKGYPAGLASRVVFEELDASAEHRRD